jgi:protein-tyrosine kinase
MAQPDEAALRPSIPAHDLIELHEATFDERAPQLLGDFLCAVRPLSSEDLERIGQYQRKHGVRFGEAAIALGLASTEEVLQALAQQFRYRVADEAGKRQRPELVVLNQPFGHQAEAFRAVRSQYLLHTREVAEKRPLAVISPSDKDGKSFFCANLGAALAQLSGRVLVIDANLRQPRLHEVFGVNNTQGLSSVLSGRGGRGVIQPVAGIENLFIMPVGVQPPNPLEMIESLTFRLLLQEVMKRFDHVLVDTPAYRVGMDAVVTAARCGSALLVSRRNANKISELQELVGALESAQVDMAGVVINDY